MKKNPTTLLIALSLGLVTLALYWPTTRQGFVLLDDPTYVYQNPHVHAGLTGSGVAWAFTSGYASNWHPLTWISHMVDCQVYGLNPGGHHFTSILLHALNSVLVFLVFRAMTGACWRSAFVAALFAWHPLHVESVAWAAERKDVLSTFFFLLTLWTYTRYLRAKTAGPSTATLPSGQAETHTLSNTVALSTTDSQKTASSWVQWYILSLALFALGLMSKPMVVTLPCLLLLLDFWPLQRLSLPLLRPDTATVSALLPLLVEKIPFFALSFAACVITFLVQKAGGAVASITYIPLGPRLANALMAYPRYLIKTFWPANLCVFYPLPDHWPVLPVLGAAMLLLTFSVFAFAWSRSRPYLWVGWFWFFGTLVPTIGLVQVGSQSMADRYMYIPSLGLFMILTWGLAELSQAWSAHSASAVARFAFLGDASKHQLSRFVCFISAAALLSCVVCTTRQICYWHDEETLFRHALEATPNNYLACDHLAKVCEQTDRKPEAESFYLALLRLKPRYPEGQYNLGTLEMERGNLDAAAEHLAAAIALRPGFASAHCNLGLTRFRQNRLAEAADELRLACQLAPQNVDTHVNLGVTLLAMNSPAEAADSFARALTLSPGVPGTHFLLALALSRAEKTKEAVVQAERAHELAISTGQTEVAAKAADLLKACQSSQ